MTDDEPITLREAAERRFVKREPVRAGVYIIGYGDKVKIGFTENFTARFSGLKMAIPEDFVVYGFLDGLKREDEQTLHFWCRAYRIRGEWFRKEGLLATWIEAACPGSLIKKTERAGARTVQCLPPHLWFKR